MTMIRGTATVLVMVLSLALGHAPCCVIPSQCCERIADGGHDAAAHRGKKTESCCAKCRRESRRPDSQPAKASACACPKIAGVLVLAHDAEFEPAALPELLPATDSLRLSGYSVAVAAGLFTPPRAALSLPLLL